MEQTEPHKRQRKKKPVVPTTPERQKRIKAALKQNIYNEISLILKVPNQNFSLHASAGARTANIVMKDMAEENVSRKEVSAAFVELVGESLNKTKLKRDDTEIYFLKIKKECERNSIPLALKKQRHKPEYEGFEI